MCMIAVADTGIGMTADASSARSSRSSRPRTSAQGTGLGLSQVYGFVRQSAGHVRIYSELGRGTTVKIYLPRHAGADRARSTAAEPTRRRERGDRNARRILVVEDDEALRAYTVETLGELGYRVLAATERRGGARHPRQRTPISTCCSPTW